MKSKYNVGDIVFLKKKYDPGCNASDYPHTFAEPMLRLPRKIATIERVVPMISDEIALHSQRKMYTEPFKYYLKEVSWTWVDAMFEDISEES